MIPPSAGRAPRSAGQAPRSAGQTRLVCPHCGNCNQSLIEDNNASKTSVYYTLLCVARVLPRDAYDGDDVEPREPEEDGKVVCGMQWSPNV